MVFFHLIESNQRHTFHATILYHEDGTIYTTIKNKEKFKELLNRIKSAEKITVIEELKNE